MNLNHIPDLRPSALKLLPNLNRGRDGWWELSIHAGDGESLTLRVRKGGDEDQFKLVYGDAIGRDTEILTDQEWDERKEAFDDHRAQLLHAMYADGPMPVNAGEGMESFEEEYRDLLISHRMLRASGGYCWCIEAGEELKRHWVLLCMMFNPHVTL